jgi:hypothetical protein
LLAAAAAAEITVAQVAALEVLELALVLRVVAQAQKTAHK